MRMRHLWLTVAVFLLAGVCWAQDPVKVDPKHYKVETENAHVRVLRIHYDPHEKSVMHSHPNSVVVYLTDGTIRMTTPDGKKADVKAQKGQTEFTPAGVHNPENVGDAPFEAILVELKGGHSGGAAKPSSGKAKAEPKQ